MQRDPLPKEQDVGRCIASITDVLASIALHWATQHLKLIRLKEEQESDMRDFLDLMEHFKKGIEELGALHSQQFPHRK
ncbi:hypothetical protein XfCFBP8356_003650 [Xylella fastidiosa subsp. sandyi]|uniref:hypothetical protein n=1 Tax=Xylella fastidiosa TaxID=2371 RepID=UPI000707484B|nr:hypothetical protein [Xylella fastidiosa]KQH74673.1 hypothetical protein AOT81_02315 [Xylella fastidiosa]RWA43575.1 hypothetical protein XfCFBP8356_11125 [Xylella fastidiosa subsp. sandyi]WNY19685.1 hypothetical protein RO839_03385 [Xylella fastidiosa]WNY21981.1 hypothetical protein RO838_03410 [Xylella fastidiosa]